VDTALSFRWTSASASHAGRVRKLNEDACLEQSERGLWAVADGMGGHAQGEFASRLAVRSLMDLPAVDDFDRSVAQARQCLSDTNARLRAEAARRDVPMIGTTIAVLLAAQGRCACLWAGDSRIYLYRNGRLQQLTRDHSQREAVRELQAASGSSDDTWIRPPANVITRALGGDDTIEIDCVTLDAIDGDVFLLCSDGLTNEVGDLLIEQALLPGDCQHACDTLIELALEHGGHDNVTAVVVSAEDLCSPDRTVILPVL
jgi:protein phosphatase